MINLRQVMVEQKRQGILYPNQPEDITLTWEDSYAIALAIRKYHPGARAQNLSLELVYQWAVALPGFCDDPQLANDEILLAIIQEWLEEEPPNE